MENKLLLGVARKIISPAVGGQLFGYSPDVFSESLHDDLTATAFYFEQGGVKALMLSATICSWQSELADCIVQTIEARSGIPATHCILHATHTHSGPNVTGSYGWGDIDMTYCEQILIPAILAAVDEAMAAPVAVRVEIRQGKSLVGINRRQLTVENKVILGQNPWGPFDPRMTVITFADDSGKAVADMIHYGCHGTASGINRQITRDWSGVMIDAMEDETGGITAFFNGPEGDVGPRLANGKTTGDRDVRCALELGAVAAKDALAIRRNTASSVEPVLEVTRRTLQVPLAPRIPLQEARELLESFSGHAVNLKGKKRHYYECVVASYAEGYEELEFLEVPQTVVRIGDVAFVSFPFELFSEIGMRIAEASPYPYTLSLSNTGGNEGYFVTEDQIIRGGYEVGMYQTANLQPYAPHADHSVILQTLAHLKGET